MAEQGKQPVTPAAKRARHAMRRHPPLHRATELPPRGTAPDQLEDDRLAEDGSGDQAQNGNEQLSRTDERTQANGCLFHTPPGPVF